MAKFQLCAFKRKRMGEWERGLALLESGFGCSDVKLIIDEQGKKLSCKPWDYHLLYGFAHITIDTGAAATLR